MLCHFLLQYNYTSLQVKSNQNMEAGMQAFCRAFLQRTYHYDVITLLNRFHICTIHFKFSKIPGLSYCIKKYYVIHSTYSRQHITPKSSPQTQEIQLLAPVYAISAPIVSHTRSADGITEKTEVQ